MSLPAKCMRPWFATTESSQSIGCTMHSPCSGWEIWLRPAGCWKLFLDFQSRSIISNWPLHTLWTRCKNVNVSYVRLRILRTRLGHKWRAACSIRRGFTSVLFVVCTSVHRSILWAASCLSLCIDSVLSSGYRRARQKFEQAAQSTRSDPHLLYSIALCHFKENNASAALKVLAEVIEQVPAPASPLCCDSGLHIQHNI